LTSTPEEAKSDHQFMIHDPSEARIQATQDVNPEGIF
jgi:hypothetical protein